MKKALSILLTFMLVLALFTACGSDEPEAPAANNNPAGAAAEADDADDYGEEDADEGDGGDTAAEQADFVEAFEALWEQQTELVALMNDLIDEGYEIDAEYVEKINALSDSITVVNDQINNGELETLTSEQLAMITEQVTEYGVAVATLRGVLEGLTE